MPEEIEVQTGNTGSTVQLSLVRLIAGDWPARFGGGPRGLTGIEHGARGERMMVTRVRPGSPAERAGLRPGDIVSAIDGTPTAGLGWENRSYVLQGPPNTEVLLEVEGAAGQNRSVQLTRSSARPAPSLGATRAAP